MYISSCNLFIIMLNPIKPFLFVQCVPLNYAIVKLNLKRFLGSFRLNLNKSFFIKSVSTNIVLVFTVFVWLKWFWFRGQ